MLFSQNTVLVPDYNKPQNIVGEGGDYNPNRNYYPRSGSGKYLSSNWGEHYWTATSNIMYDIGTYFTWKAPAPGYFAVYASFDLGEYYNTDKSLLPNTLSLRVGIRRGQYSATEVFSFTTQKNTTLYKASDIIPVAKGDIIYWGTWHKGDGVPAQYGITFYPAKPVDAKTGD